MKYPFLKKEQEHYSHLLVLEVYGDKTSGDAALGKGSTRGHLV